VPLNKKGKKIMKSMKDQYGSKRGEQVFYASMNKGNIKGVEKKKNGGLGEKSGPPPKKGPSSQGIKVLKLRGGGMDMGNAANQAQSAAMGNATSAPGPGSTGGEGGFNPRDRSTSQFGAKGSSPTSTGGGGTVKPPKTTQSNFFSGFTNAIDKGMTLPISGAGAVITGLKAIENARRAKRAKGEYFTSSKKIMPITRDFYRTEGRKLDTRIGSADEDYLKAAGVSGFGIPKTPEEGNSTPRIVTCPDGSMPPCVDTTKSVTPGGRNPVTPYKFNFEYRDGGLVRGSGKVLKGKVKKARIY
jgi:hypothetical protein